MSQATNDLECGVQSLTFTVTDDGSACFSDADDGSCCSQFYSTADGYCDEYSVTFPSDPEIGEALDSRSVSSAAAESDCSVQVEDAEPEIKLQMGKLERDCRICHLGLESNSPESGIAIELGCSCKGDLAAAHQHCAESWFKIKGNKTCEICNSIALNVVGVNEIELARQLGDEVTTMGASTISAPASPTAARGRCSCCNGHRFLNFLLGCMVFAFVISWLFRFNIPT